MIYMMTIVAQSMGGLTQASEIAAWLEYGAVGLLVVFVSVLWKDMVKTRNEYTNERKESDKLWRTSVERMNERQEGVCVKHIELLQEFKVQSLKNDERMLAMITLLHKDVEKGEFMDALLQLTGIKKTR